MKMSTRSTRVSKSTDFDHIDYLNRGEARSLSQITSQIQSLSQIANPNVDKITQLYKIADIMIEYLMFNHLTERVQELPQKVIQPIRWKYWKAQFVSKEFLQYHMHRSHPDRTMNIVGDEQLQDILEEFLSIDLVETLWTDEILRFRVKFQAHLDYLLTVTMNSSRSVPALATKHARYASAIQKMSTFDRKQFNISVLSNEEQLQMSDEEEPQQLEIPVPDQVPQSPQLANYQREIISPGPTPLANMHEDNTVYTPVPNEAALAPSVQTQEEARDLQAPLSIADLREVNAVIRKSSEVAQGGVEQMEKEIEVPVQVAPKIKNKTKSAQPPQPSSQLQRAQITEEEKITNRPQMSFWPNIKRAIGKRKTPFFTKQSLEIQTQPKSISSPRSAPFMAQKIRYLKSPKVSTKIGKFSPRGNLETQCSTTPFHISQATDPDSPVLYGSDDELFADDLPPMNATSAIQTGPFLAKKFDEHVQINDNLPPPPHESKEIIKPDSSPSKSETFVPWGRMSFGQEAKPQSVMKPTYSRQIQPRKNFSRSSITEFDVESTQLDSSHVLSWAKDLGIDPDFETHYMYIAKRYSKEFSFDGQQFAKRYSKEGTVDRRRYFKKVLTKARSTDKQISETFRKLDHWTYEKLICITKHLLLDGKGISNQPQTDGVLVRLQIDDEIQSKLQAIEITPKAIQEQQERHQSLCLIDPKYKDAQEEILHSLNTFNRGSLSPKRSIIFPRRKKFKIPSKPADTQEEESVFENVKSKLLKAISIGG